MQIWHDIDIWDGIWSSRPGESAAGAWAMGALMLGPDPDFSYINIVPSLGISSPKKMGLQAERRLKLSRNCFMFETRGKR